VNAYLPEPADRPPADQRREPVRGTLIERAKTVANAANDLPKLLILFAGAPEEIELLTPMCGRLRVGKNFLHVCRIGRCGHVFGLFARFT
jgi:hypothetical protein